MKKWFLMAAVVAAGAVVAGAAVGAEAAGESPSVGFRFETDHAEALYRCGEEAVFTVTATNGAGTKVTSGQVTLSLDNYGTNVFVRRTVDLAKENPLTVKGKLDEPGFLRLTLAGAAVGKKSLSRWAVGYEPTKIRPAAAAPDDFDAFWKAAQERLETTVPLDPRLVHVPERSQGAFDFWRISFATFGGKRVWGFLSVPKDKSKAPFPVSFEAPSAGEGKWTIDMQGEPDRIRMYMTVHPFDPPATVEENVERHKRLREELGFPSYGAAGLAGRPEDYYFYPAVLGINRAANWLWNRDDVDRTRFEYEGGSQGGFFGWMLCGLNPKFTSAVLRVPAGSDLRAPLVGRHSAWPDPLGCYPAEKRAAVVRNVGYYDGVSFASRIRCPVRVSVGFIDNTCPPSAVYATFNSLGSADKAIFNCIGQGHGGQTAFSDRLAKRWQRELRTMPRPNTDEKIPIWKDEPRVPFDVRPHRPVKKVEYGAVTDIFEPWMTFHRAPGEGMHPAVIVCPGGGYFRLGLPPTSNGESLNVANWLNGLGYDAFILAYRVSPEKNPDGAAADAQRALEIVRNCAQAWQIDPNRVGMIGFSAGANLTARTCCAPVRPDFALVIYPFWMERERNTAERHAFLPRIGFVPDVRTPPTFLVQAQDDVCRVESALTHYIQLKYAGVPTEMHLFATGGHGYNLATKKTTGVEQWPKLAESWLKRLKQ